MPEEKSQITIISDLLKRDLSYKEVIDQLEERLYNRYMVYLADKPQFNAKTQAIPKPHLMQILSFKNTLELNKIAKKYGMSQEQRDGLPAILWKIFYREAGIKNLPQMLNSELALDNIRSAYLMAIDIANLYLPISDYLGDIPMVIKRWQYEIPTESTQNSTPIPVVAIPQIMTVPQAMPTPVPISVASPPPTSNLQSPISAVTPPPIRPRSTIMEQHLTEHSDIEPEYLPDDLSSKTLPKMGTSASILASIQTEPLNDSIPEEGSKTHPSNVINLKNF